MGTGYPKTPKKIPPLSSIFAWIDQMDNYFEIFSHRPFKLGPAICNI